MEVLSSRVAQIDELRPSFWLWVTEMNKTEPPIQLRSSRRGYDPRNAPTSTSGYKGDDFLKLKESGENGKWKNIIERDVTRAFGNMPPHKTGARYRQDSIVRALVSFGHLGWDSFVFKIND